MSEMLHRDLDQCGGEIPGLQVTRALPHVRSEQE